MIPSLLLSTSGGRQTFKKMKQYYNHLSHHLNLQNPFLGHSASDNKIVWAYPVAAAVPTQVQPGVGQHSACPGSGPGPFNFSHCCLHPSSHTHTLQTPCSCPQTFLLSSNWSLVLSLLVGNSFKLLPLYLLQERWMQEATLSICYFPSFILHILFCKDLQQELLLNFPFPHLPMTIYNAICKLCPG